MLKSTEYAKLFTSIMKQQPDIILHARKSLLFSKDKTWEKTINESLFDITMGSYDGAKICEPVGLYILSILGRVYAILNVGLHRDDGLACLHKISEPASKRYQKDTERYHKDFPGELWLENNYHNKFKDS